MMGAEKILILGGGESGVGAALLAKKVGFEPLVSEHGLLKELYRSELQQAEISFEENGHVLAFQQEYNLIIVSPGIPDTTAVISHFSDLGSPMISEIEFAWRYIGSAQLIGITGSNGKTTVASLIYHCMSVAGYKAALVGNIGQSFARTVASGEYDYYVCELSSFQLDKVETLRPHIAVMTNITPDHLDRYEYNFENYIAAKMRITAHQDSSDLLVINSSDQATVTHLNTEARTIAVISQPFYSTDYTSHSGHKYQFNSTQLIGRHNWLNIAQSIEVLENIGISVEHINSGINSFIPVPHRMEVVGIVSGVKYINDSKATNVDSTFYALDAMTAPVIWIVGGTDKGNDYAPLFGLIKEKVRWMIFLGIDNSPLISALRHTNIGFTEVKSMQDAVKTAEEKATAGDVVLLSPACASFDLFKNYEDRGDQFKLAIGRLDSAQKRAGLISLI